MTPRIPVTHLLLAAALVLPLVGAACSKPYYAAWEALGKMKPDLLIDRVQDARKEQEEAKEQFGSALDRFSELVAFQGGDLRAAYDRAKSDFDRCESQANDVHARVDAVEKVGEDLFDEWKKEIAQYESRDLASRSRSQLRETNARFDDMLRAMRRAEATMEPVLSAFRDQTLFLKHNLNAQAVASLKGEVASLERDIGALIKEMERSIEESERFIKQMEQVPTQT